MFNRGEKVLLPNGEVGQIEDFPKYVRGMALVKVPGAQEALLFPISSLRENYAQP